MKFAIFTVLFALLASLALAAAPQKPIIISYPDDTPDSILDEAKAAIKAAGGVITHEYNLIKAFAAKASESSLEKITAMADKYDKYKATIEEDQTMSIAGGTF